jgi:hypothetical protein
MGRIVDLFGEVAAEAEEGPEGLILSPDAWDRLREEWQDEDIEDALGLVHESLLQGELVESADSLSARLVEVLGGFGDDPAFQEASQGRGSLDLEVISQLVRRVARLEEVLELFRDGTPPQRRGFEALQARLADLGIEEEMGEGRESPDRHDHDDEDESS